MFDIPSEFFVYLAVGFLAQMVDGALGMAYGTLCTAVLLSTGMSPVTVSASVHAAQSVTAGISAASHITLKNVDWKIFRSLAIAGTAGGIIGALFLTHVDTHILIPAISIYLLILGVTIVFRGLRRSLKNKIAGGIRFRSALGFFGGLLDAIGSGWGPIVTSTLLARGETPRYVIGSVNTAEFVVKTAITVILIGVIGIDFSVVVFGLLAGGVLAGPLAAYSLRFINPKILMVMVGFLIIGISLYRLYTL